MQPAFHINQRLSFTPGQPHTAARCTVRYAGPVDGTAGTWLGVEWDVEGKGKHSGAHHGREYFECRAPGNASFIRAARRPDDTLSFLDGLRRKYTAAADDPHHAALSLTASKVFEEVGFDKIQRKLAQLKELRVVILDGLCLARADAPGEIAETCPKIEELDLSRNLFEDLQTVAGICGALPRLRSLKISGNRFASLAVERVPGQPSPFEGVTALEISNTYLTWDETTQILAHFPNIHTLESSLNRISAVPADITLPATLTTLNLERNTIPTLTALLPLTALPALTHLVLAHNRITALIDPPPARPPTAVFAALTHLDLTYNHIPIFAHLDALPPLTPALTSVRLSHNPFCALLPREEAHMLTLARLPPAINALNHSRVRPAERADAEMYYLARVARELAAVAESETPAVLAQHARWGALCELYGAPRIDRAAALEKRCLGARLVSLEFVCAGEGEEGAQRWVKRVPGGAAVAVVRALVARVGGREPLRVRMVVGGVAMEDGREVGYYVEGGEGRVVVE